MRNYKLQAILKPFAACLFFFSSFVKQKQKITIFLWSETIYINEALFHNFSGCFPNGNNYREGGINRTYIQTCILFLSLLFFLRSRPGGSAIFGIMRCASLRYAARSAREPKRHKESVVCVFFFCDFSKKWWSLANCSICFFFCSLCLVFFSSASFASSFF